MPASMPWGFWVQPVCASACRGGCESLCVLWPAPGVLRDSGRAVWGLWGDCGWARGARGPDRRGPHILLCSPESPHALPHLEISGSTGCFRTGGARGGAPARGLVLATAVESHYIAVLVWCKWQELFGGGRGQNGEAWPWREGERGPASVTGFGEGRAGAKAQMWKKRRKLAAAGDPLKKAAGFAKAPRRGEGASEPLTRMELAAEKHAPKPKKAASFLPKRNVRKGKYRKR